MKFTMVIELLFNIEYYINTNTSVIRVGGTPPVRYVRPPFITILGILNTFKKTLRYLMMFLVYVTIDIVSKSTPCPTRWLICLS